MGAERRVVYDFINVAQEDAKLAQALIRDKRIDTLFTCWRPSARDKDALTNEGSSGSSANSATVSIMCFATARRASSEALCAMRHADQAIVVANPEVSRCATPIASSAFSIPRRCAPSAARRWTSNCSSLASIPPVRILATCSPSTTCLRSFDSAPRRHPGEPGNPARLQHRRSRNDERLRGPGWARLSRSCPTSQRRDGSGRDPG